MTYIDDDCAEDSAQPRTAFRDAEKRYQLFRERQMKIKGGKRRAGKWQTRPIDMSAVLDLHVNACDSDGVCLHDVPGYEKPVFTLARHPGLVYLPGALTEDQHRDLIAAALTDYPEPPARTNHALHYGPLPGLWRAAQAGLRLNWTRKDDPHAGARRRMGCEYTAAKPHKFPDAEPLSHEGGQQEQEGDQQERAQSLHHDQHSAAGPSGGGPQAAGVVGIARRCESSSERMRHCSAATNESSNLGQSTNGNGALGSCGSSVCDGDKSSASGADGREHGCLNGGDVPGGGVGEPSSAGGEGEAGENEGCSPCSSRRSSGCGSEDLYAARDGPGEGGGGGGPGGGTLSFEAAWSQDGPGPPAEQLLRKLRWATLGPQFDWTQRQYDFSGAYRPLPVTLEALAKQLAAVVHALQAAGLQVLPQQTEGGGYRPDAAIVNYYQQGDTLGAHLDDVERDMGQPIVSVSLGCPAIFLMGGPTKHVAPTALLLRGGDVLVLAGEARRCYHGVPRILEPPRAQLTPQAPAAAGLLPDVESYSQCARVNISIRAVR